jgi:outer membrane protein OmpA-like peptidoglycan-associated protein
VPTPEDIERALRPAPKLGPSQGLPHLGAVPSLSFNALQFEFASARLKPESIETLRNLGNALNTTLRDEKNFLIEGHTDAAGTREYNIALSNRRAEAVKDYLVREMGVPPDRLRTLGKGSSEPVNPKKPYAAENRRVVLINLGD